MSTYRLDRLFAPRSVALVGAGLCEQSLGRTVLAQLRSGRLPRAVASCESRCPEIDGFASPSSLSMISRPPDLIAITAPASAASALNEAFPKTATDLVVWTAGDNLNDVVSILRA